MYKIVFFLDSIDVRNCGPDSVNISFSAYSLGHAQDMAVVFVRPFSHKLASSVILRMGDALDLAILTILDGQFHWQLTTNGKRLRKSSTRAA